MSDHCILQTRAKAFVEVEYQSFFFPVTLGCIVVEFNDVMGDFLRVGHGEVSELSPSGVDFVGFAEVTAEFADKVGVVVHPVRFQVSFIYCLEARSKPFESTASEIGDSEDDAVAGLTEIFGFGLEVECKLE